MLPSNMNRSEPGVVAGIQLCCCVGRSSGTGPARPDGTGSALTHQPHRRAGAGRLVGRRRPGAGVSGQREALRPGQSATGCTQCTQCTGGPA